MRSMIATGAGIAFLGFVGCASPTPPAPRGSVDVHLSNSGQPTCAASSVLKAPAGIAYPGPTILVADGDPGTSLSCRVTASSPHTFAASISYGANGANAFSVTLNASIPDGASAQMPATGSASIFDPASGGNSGYSSDACEFWIGDPTNGTGTHVSDGAIWGQFQCRKPGVVDTSTTTGSTCVVTPSTFLFEDCSD